MPSDSRSRSRSRSTTKQSTTPSICTESAISTWHFILPFLLLVIIGLAGVYLIPVFTYSNGQRTWDIGAWGYTERGNPHIRFTSLPYPTPGEWPIAVKHAPVILLLHFILGVFLLAYIFILCIIAMATEARKRGRVVRMPPVWVRLIAAILTLMVLVAAGGDLGYWVGTQNQGIDFKLAVLGWFVFVCGILFGLGWLAVQLQAMRLQKEAERSAARSASRQRT
ncbi:hypothetical protein M231_01670 [Tremella mesenterica]|uniref:Uncharacterized protein n=2 Tax=Tremella mesenterica TaxID=5217 RepID=A0A4Q1BSN0_TREME|nr:hypothetical protein M231_01670 [Tremella mesenterica]